MPGDNYLDPMIPTDAPDATRECAEWTVQQDHRYGSHWILDGERMVAKVYADEAVPLIAAAVVMRDALMTILNVEGPAKVGAQYPAFGGMDVPYHFEQVRAALRVAARLAETEERDE